MGKARLIASTDKGNMFTGFAGAERKAIINADTSKDDRPPEGISFAASNLVRSDLTSRSQRQQSAPPINRSTFPPTPPPENDFRSGMSKPQTSGPEKPAAMTARANSVRDGTGAGARMPSRRQPRPTVPMLNPDATSPRMQPDNFSFTNSPDTYVNENKPRMGTMRTASEPRGPVSKYSTARPGRGYKGDQDGPPSSRGRLFNEMTPRRQNSGEEADDEYPDELYDLYQSTAYSNPYSSGSRRAAPRQAPRRTQSNYDEVDYDRDSGGSSLDDFEMLNDAGGTLSSMSRAMSTSRNASRSRRPVDIRTVRVKMHHGDDTRYLMVNTGMIWEEFLEKAREKLQLGNRFKVRMRDEGDMITVGDGDDWEMAVQTAKREARRSGEDMARLDVSFARPFLKNLSVLIWNAGLDRRQQRPRHLSLRTTQMRCASGTAALMTVFYVYRSSRTAGRRHSLVAASVLPDSLAPPLWEALISGYSFFYVQLDYATEHHLIPITSQSMMLCYSTFREMKQGGKRPASRTPGQAWATGTLRPNSHWLGAEGSN